MCIPWDVGRGGPHGTVCISYNCKHNISTINNLVKTLPKYVHPWLSHITRSNGPSGLHQCRLPVSPTYRPLPLPFSTRTSYNTHINGVVVSRRRHDGNTGGSCGKHGRGGLAQGRNGNTGLVDGLSRTAARPAKRRHGTCGCVGTAVVRATRLGGEFSRSGGRHE